MPFENGDKLWTMLMDELRQIKKEQHYTNEKLDDLAGLPSTVEAHTLALRILYSTGAALGVGVLVYILTKSI